MLTMSDSEPDRSRRLLAGIGGVTRLVALVIGVAVIVVIGLRGPAAETSPIPTSPPAAAAGAASSATPR